MATYQIPEVPETPVRRRDVKDVKPPKGVYDASCNNARLSRNTLGASIGFPVFVTGKRAKNAYTFWLNVSMRSEKSLAFLIGTLNRMGVPRTAYVNRQGFLDDEMLEAHFRGLRDEGVRYRFKLDWTPSDVDAGVKYDKWYILDAADAAAATETGPDDPSAEPGSGDSDEIAADDIPF